MKLRSSILNGCLVLSVGLLSGLISSSYAQVAAVVSGVSTGATISQIFDGLDDLIDKAAKAGDYVTMRAAIEAKGAIETWKTANLEILDKAFSELSETQRQMFSNARQLTEQANLSIGSNIETAQLLVVQANQIVESLPYTNNTYITKFSPRVKPAQAATFVTIKVNGVNLDKGDPKLMHIRGEAPRMIVGPLEVQYSVPSDVISSSAEGLSTVPLALVYSTPRSGFWNRILGRREVVERQLPLVVLPTTLGSYNFLVETKTQQKEVKVHRAQQQLFSGKNKTVLDIAKPPQDWRWDWSQGVGAFKQVGGGGEAGHCNGIDESKSSPDGITQSARVDMIKQLNPFDIKYGPGWQKCAVEGPIYRMQTITTKLPVSSGMISWTEDLKLALPQNYSALSLEIVTFDKRKRLFTDTGADKFFDVIRGAQEVLIRPRQPADL